MIYKEIVSHYEACLEQYGDTHLGVDWPRKEDVIKRYRIMLEVVRENEGNISVLDFGCGAAHLYDYIIEQEIEKINYSGLDISEKFITLCKKKHPDVAFYCADILSNEAAVPQSDYIILNGVFTEKRSIGYKEMLVYLQKMLKMIFPLARKGVAFNVMSKQVDWEREELFHLPLDEMADFVTQHLTRHLVVRNDYGLFEYTVYLYHEPIGEN
jgi:SAM-dependent methyltransferase